MPLRQYARWREARGLPGGTLASVQKAISSGRLASSLDADGTIADPDAADSEWEANTDTTRRPPHAYANPGARPAIPPEIPPLATSRARREAALAERAEFELAQLQGRYVPVDRARADVMERFAIVRTKLLGVPSRVAQRMPSIAAQVVPLIEESIREALEELASMDDSPEDRE